MKPEGAQGVKTLRSVKRVKKQLLAGMALIALAGCSGGGSVGGGSRLLVTREIDGNRDVYVLGTNGVQLSRLTTDSQSDESPRWSPDGSRIAFIRRNPLLAAPIDAQTLFLMNADGSGAQSYYPGLLTVADTPYDPTWLGNTTLIFRRGFGTPTNLVKRATTGGDFANLTTPETSIDSVPAVSPDGTKLAFVRGSGESGALFLANADGTGARSVIAGVAKSAPAFSPDGMKLAFVHLKDGNQEIYVASADGTGPVRLTSNAAADFSPVWSPNGKKILFASARDGNNELYTMNADGTNALRITNNAYSDIPYGWR
jgi:Tol biopolymer transport system component